MPAPQNPEPNPSDSPLRRWRRIPVTDLAVGVILVLVALTLVGVPAKVKISAQWLVPILVIVAGALLAWSQLDAGARGRLLQQAGGRTPWGVVRLAGGLGLVVLGVVAAVSQGSEPSTAITAGVAALAVLAGVALVLAPWWLRVIQNLGEERALRERADERAYIAAHLHDSVLQTLALIQRSSSDPATVVRLARTQERELRQWLYQDETRTGTSLAADVRAIAAAVEEHTSVPVDVVAVGDGQPTENTFALLQATREALMNATRHGRPPVTLYMEAGPQDVEVSVRDHGDGFVVEEVSPDRFGVRESIMGRLSRRGGSVEIRQVPSGGTDVRMRIAWEYGAESGANTEESEQR